MPRRKPTSTTQKKASQKLKRAVKRGDASPPPKAPARTRARRPPALRDPNREAAAASARKLESRFLRPTASYLSLTAHLASTEPLPRPLPASASYFPAELLEQVEGIEPLTCPKRPKWRYEMTKKEVERNEEGVFARWKDEVDAKLSAWRDKTREEGSVPGLTYYEQNLDVWRQLWRVTELADILLLLVDARSPPTHFPPSLRAYLSTLRPSRPLILVLTKSDVVGPDRAAEWENWLKRTYAEEGVRVVRAESYSSEGGRRPGIPSERKRELVRALREAHEDLLRPPPHVRVDPEKVKKWNPRVKESVDWEAVERGTGMAGIAVHDDPPMSVHGESVDGEDDDARTPEKEPEFLTIGLIGQPNVGKSSLLNALFGHTRVRASRTPGKTKHFQTLFLTPQLRLVDCPGLVFPSYTPAPHQALAAVLPISQLPSLAACITYAAGLVPLEEVLRLGSPEDGEKGMEDKRTWRGERARDEGGKGRTKPWTAMALLEAYALQKGWVTAKAGRPDVNRAGNAIMRALAEGRIGWGFRPPLCDTEAEHGEVEGKGIWLGGEHVEEAPQSEWEEEEESESAEEEEEEEEEESEEEVADGRERVKVGGGLFAALVDEDADDTDEEEEASRPDTEEPSVGVT